LHKKEYATLLLAIAQAT